MSELTQELPPEQLNNFRMIHYPPTKNKKQKTKTKYKKWRKVLQGCEAIRMTIYLMNRLEQEFYFFHLQFGWKYL